MKKEKNKIAYGYDVIDLFSQLRDTDPNEYGPESGRNKKECERIRGYWPMFYEDINRNNGWNLFMEPDEYFDFSFSKEGTLTLLFYFPSKYDSGLDAAAYKTMTNNMIKAFTPINVTPSEDDPLFIDSLLSRFIHWELEAYVYLELDAEKEEQLKLLLEPYCLDNSYPDENLNILLTNQLQIRVKDAEEDTDFSELRVEVELNALTMAYIIDHFDEDAQDFLFDYDRGIKWWWRVDGEGFEYFINQALPKSASAITDEKSGSLKTLEWIAVIAFSPLIIPILLLFWFLDRNLVKKAKDGEDKLI